MLGGCWPGEIGRVVLEVVLRVVLEVVLRVVLRVVRRATALVSWVGKPASRHRLSVRVPNGCQDPLFGCFV